MVRLILLILLCGLVACGGVPEAPEWEVTVAAPFDTERIEIDDFLPSGVDTARVGGAKVFVLPEVAQSGGVQFSDVCPTCPAGVATDIPAFSYADSVALGLPTGVVQIELADGEARLSATNNLGFTLLGATGDGSGRLDVVVVDEGSGAELGRSSVSGPGSEWDDGETLDVVVPLNAAAITDGLRVRFVLSSPAFTLPQPVLLDASTALNIDGALRSLAVSAVVVGVDGVALSRTAPVDLDLDQGAEDVIDERVLGADVEFQLLHDIPITGPFVVTIADSEAALFSGDPLREIELGRFSFEADVVQRSTIDAATVRRILDMPQTWIGYSAVGTGTLADPPGHGPLSRFTPESGFATRVRIATRLLVGGDR